ncbi:hypothetical protein [Candidatus Arthromitus sp. SFB-rat-Yit]|uniref:hypothetical protein n=1 Tax=Candidatus Arthromitus sp. SFB-rat-Yit TaxID=1041504 RepID=UPI000227A37E|nr:hypothetical protein [Candidatus Arthromitus sp. SFB-rat-Yit]BAK80883.1 hypothetical protein RATSFB_0321 [Candidatus Arthromitus sp. SFB-rat-Yit]
MVKNMVMLCVSLLLLVFLITNKVSALKDPTQEYYNDSGIYFLNSISIDKLRDNFVDKFVVLDADTEKNNILIKENKELNNRIKKRLDEIKVDIGNNIWKEIRGYKNEINDKKISTRNKIKQLINDQKRILENENYSDESLSRFINILIDTQKLRRESIEFEKIHLNKINALIL